MLSTRWSTAKLPGLQLQLESRFKQKQILMSEIDLGIKEKKRWFLFRQTAPTSENTGIKFHSGRAFFRSDAATPFSPNRGRKNDRKSHNWNFETVRRLGFSVARLWFVSKFEFIILHYSQSPMLILQEKILPQLKDHDALSYTSTEILTKSLNAVADHHCDKLKMSRRQRLQSSARAIKMSWVWIMTGFFLFSFFSISIIQLCFLK